MNLIMKKTTSQNSKKTLFAAILATIAMFGAVQLYAGLFNKQSDSDKHLNIEGVYLAKPQEINDFKLTGTKDKTFSKANLQGHWSMLYFGFTNCGMVCPTTMAALNDMYKLLEKDLPADHLPQVVMISVDPDRDSIERMKEYVTSFNPHFLGARSDILETVKLEKQLHITATKVNVGLRGKNQYSIKHSDQILLFNPKGQLQAYLSAPHVATRMAKDYKLILNTVG